MRRVLVTGVGLVTPLGVGVEVNWRRLLAGEGAVRRLASLEGLPAQIAAVVPRGDAEHEFSPTRSALSLPGDESSLSRFVQFSLAASAEALAQARWSPQTREQQERTGVSIGSGIGGLSDIIEASDALRERGVRRVSPYFIPKMLVNMAAGQVSIRAGLRGPSAAPATACATGAHALADGLRMIRSGEADVVVAGGAEACVEPLAVAGFSRARALATSFNDAPGQASRPFDASREGFVMGASK
jgi:3-oxoacyl-[acyl-carrier-protein] synthase II